MSTNSRVALNGLKVISFFILSLLYCFVSTVGLELYVFLSICYFILLLLVGLLNDFRKSTCLFNAFFLVFVVGGSIFHFSVRGFDETIAFFIASFFALLNFSNYLFGIKLSNVNSVEQTDWKSRRTIILNASCYFFIILGILFAVLFYLKIGYIPLLSGASPKERIEAMQGNGFYLQMLRFSIYASMIVYLVTKKRVSLILFALTELLLLGVGFRGTVAQNIIIFLISVFFVKGKALTWKYAVVWSLLGIIFIMIVANARGEIGDLTIAYSLLHTLSVSVSNFAFIYTHFNDFQYGGTFFYNFMMFVPGPNIDYTQWLAQQVPINFEGGITPTILGDLYVNFGLFFVAFSVPISILLYGIDKELILSKYSSLNPVKVLLIVNISVLLSRSITGGFSNQSLNIVLTTVFLSAMLVVSKLKIKSRVS